MNDQQLDPQLAARIESSGRRLGALLWRLTQDSKFQRASFLGDRLALREALFTVARELNMHPYGLRRAYVVVAAAAMFNHTIDPWVFDEQPLRFQERLFANIAEYAAAVSWQQRRGVTASAVPGQSGPNRRATIN